MRRAQIVPVVLPCPACHATYNLAVSYVKEGGVPRWDYVLPDNCRHCGEPLDTVANHVGVRDTARRFL